MDELTLEEKLCMHRDILIMKHLVLYGQYKPDIYFVDYSPACQDCNGHRYYCQSYYPIGLTGRKGLPLDRYE